VQNREEISHQKVMISPTVYTRTMLPHYLVKNNSCDVDRPHTQHINCVAL